MRIGIDARLLHYTRAGISQYILRLLEGLAALDVNEEVIVLRSRRDRPESLPRTSFPSVPLWTPPHNRFEQFALRVELGSLGLDLLHSPDFIPPLKRRFRSIVTVHDLAFLLYPHMLTRESAHYYGQIDQGVRSANHIIAVSESTKRDVTHLLGAPEDRVTVIPEAIHPLYRQMEDRVAVNAVRVRYGLPKDFILFVGTIEPRKNLANLFRAIRLLIDQHNPDIVLAVGGEWGWLYDEALQVLKQLKLEQAVRFLGHVPLVDLVPIYNAATVLAYPSYYEGFGLPPLEAMACGTPVVASDTSSMPEVVGDAGLLVPPDDYEALAVSLWRVLSDKGLRGTLVRRGLQRAAAFSVPAMAERTLELYRAVLAG